MCKGRFVEIFFDRNVPHSVEHCNEIWQFGCGIYTEPAAEGVDMAVGYFHWRERTLEVCGAVATLGKSVAVRSN